MQWCLPNVNVAALESDGATRFKWQNVVDSVRRCLKESSRNLTNLMARCTWTLRRCIPDPRDMLGAITAQHIYVSGGARSEVRHFSFLLDRGVRNRNRSSQPRFQL